MPLTVSDHPALRMNVAEAKQRPDISGLPFVFFADDTTGRGNVLYHCYDGHYGLISPSGQQPGPPPLALSRRETDPAAVGGATGRGTPTGRP
ncbi:sigma 54 modulation/S30EA ribosomal C-terminal domain-containing protein [Streptomyces shenzhenensis]|uniref:sigma 54 modulation/S30EA ribosomal C-terminal domain-containing protein n=1 Tax=Streptomyces shenzhenensis TaxID=943815 RepID=UPI003D8A0DB2